MSGKTIFNKINTLALVKALVCLSMSFGWALNTGKASAASAKMESLNPAHSLCAPAGNLLNSSCENWIANVLQELGNGKNIGQHIADYINPASGHGVKVIFLPLNGVEALQIYPNIILINSNRYNGNGSSSEAISTLAHEITHMQQGIKGFSVQAEMLTARLEYELESEMGLEHDWETELAAENGLNPWNDDDLKYFQNYVGGSLKFAPLHPINGDLPQNWLEEWGGTNL